MNPPNTTRIATSGIMELMPSIDPRFVSSPTSVSHALKHASLALEPKKVITQSITITNVTPIEAATVTSDTNSVITSILMNAKLRMEIPQSRYPRQMMIFLLPSLSDRAPMSSVVTVAATALADTISEICAAVA